MSLQEKRNLRIGLLFVAPWILGFLLYELYPLGASFYFSLTRYDIIRDPVFIGFKNYIDLFTDDATFPTVLWNTLYYVGFGVPIGIAFAFIVANLLNTKIVGRAFFRGVIYLPSIVPAVASAMIWQFLMSVQYGAINGILRTLSLPIIPFLANPSWAKPSLILVSVWAQGAAVVIFLAALQDVPRSLYEAATVDGANRWQQFRNITIPMTSPIILFNLIIGFINGFQSFTVPWLLTEGGPLNSTEFLLVHLYRNAFEYFRMGKASAIAYVMFVIIVIFTILMFRSSDRWVHYGGE
ncbi:MAG: sugar ABC transporter permease [Anaerolineales bacterium]|nr:sugar ABC transporter permease [Anaerolineales bacterium]